MLFRMVLLDWELKFVVIKNFPDFDAILYSLPCLNKCHKVSRSLPIKCSQNGNTRVDKNVEIISLSVKVVECVLS